VEGRYAHALYSASIKSKSLEKVEEELHFVRDVLVKQQGFKQFLEDPGVSRYLVSFVGLIGLILILFQQHQA
jgi:F-type H+-transporting ATPase subunit O